MSGRKPTCLSVRHDPALRADKKCPACGWTPARERKLQEEEADRRIRWVMNENLRKRAGDLLARSMRLLERKK